MVKFTAEVGKCEVSKRKTEEPETGPSKPGKQRHETESIDDDLTEGIAIAIYTNGSK
jgi:hypothetical protein